MGPVWRVDRVTTAAALALAGCVPSYGTTASDAATADSGDAATSDAATGDAARPADAGEAGAESGADAGSILCHSGGGATYTHCPVATGACCGVFAAVPDFCVPFPDTNHDCQSGTNPVALVSCNDATQCKPGDVCCAANLDVNGGSYSAIACAPMSLCIGTSGVACGTILDAPDDSTCTGGTSCTGVIDVYRFCQ